MKLIVVLSTFLLSFIVRADFTCLDQLAALTQQTFQNTARLSRIIESGVPSSYFDGYREAERMLLLAQKLRSGLIDPTSTHLPEFSNKIPLFFRRIENFIAGQEGHYLDTVERLETLAAMRREYADRVVAREVSYEYWVVLSQRLAILATPEIERTAPFISVTQSMLAQHDIVYRRYFGPGAQYTHFLQRFPDVLLMPTMETMGVASFNPIFSFQVYPIGLVSEQLSVDGRRMWPDSYWKHDLEHADAFARFTHSVEQVRLMQEKHLSIMSAINNERGLRRLQLEFVYFIFTHEYPHYIREGHLLLGWQYVINSFRRSDFFVVMEDALEDPDHFRALLPPSVNVRSLANIRLFLNDSLDVFQEVVVEQLGLGAVD